MAVSAGPLLKHLGLPLSVNWSALFSLYWIRIGARSLSWALLLVMFACTPHHTFGEFFLHIRNRILPIVLAITGLLLGLLFLPWSAAVLLSLNIVVLFELIRRTRADTHPFSKRVLWTVICGTYLFAGITLVFIYNDVVVASRFPISHDSTLNAIDLPILGHSVSVVAHTMMLPLPVSFLKFLDLAYFELFILLGIALIFVSYVSLTDGLRFVGTCMTAYYLTLLIFYLWPSYGPYMYCPQHSVHYPFFLAASVFQSAGMPNLIAISHRQIRHVATGYYIAFPSMHVALPVISAWFLRRWRLLAWVMAAYIPLVIFAIIVLEWHYAIDLVGGIGIGLLALWMVGPEENVLAEAPAVIDAPPVDPHRALASSGTGRG